MPRRTRAGRAQGQGPPQRLPSGQGAGQPPQEGLWPLGDGRDHRPDHPRHQHADLHRARLQPRDRAQDHDADRGKRGRGHPVRQVRSHLHRLDRGGARRSRSPISRALRSRSRWSKSPTPTSTRPSSASPTRTAPMPPRPRAPRPKTATASRSPSRAPSTASPFEGGTGEGIQVVIGAGQFIPGFEDQLIGIAVRRDPHPEGLVPEELRQREAGRPGRRVRDHGDRDRSAAGHTRSTTSSPRRSAWNCSTS